MRLDKVLAKNWAVFVVLTLAIGVVWGHAVMFGFVWDDNNFIVDLQSIRSLKNIPRMFFDIEAQTTLARTFLIFRPLRNVHYALLYALGGQSSPQPWLYHLANLAWHLGVCCLLFIVVRRLLQKVAPSLAENEARRWAFMGALAFAVHPTTSEVVCWAKSLDDLMVSAFVLCALRELLVWNPGSYWRSLLFFILALYSKESAVPFAIIPFFVFRRIQPLPLRRNLVLTSGFLATAALYMLHRHLVLGRSSQIAPLSGSYVQTLVDMLPVVTQYFRLLWGIPPFCADYSFMRGGNPFFSAPVMLGLMILVLLIAAGIFAWRKPVSVPVAFGLLWTGTFLLPVSNLLPLAAYMAERFLYTPLIGWIIALVAVLAQFPRRRVLLVFSVVCIAIWGFVAWNRSFIWRDALTLFVRTSRDAPSRRMEENAISAIFKLPDVQKVFRLDPATHKLNVTGNLDSAAASSIAATFEQAHRWYPTNDTITAALAISYVKSGRVKDAVPLFEQTATNDPGNVDHWNNLAQASIEAKDYVRARAALEKAASLAPQNVKRMRLQARLELETGNATAALQLLKTLAQLDKSTDYGKLIEEAAKASQRSRP